MFVCPCDAHWCNLSACRAGACELTGETPLIACSECGAIVETSPGFRLCVDCLVEFNNINEGV